MKTETTTATTIAQNSKIMTNTIQSSASSDDSFGSHKNKMVKSQVFIE